VNVWVAQCNVLLDGWPHSMSALGRHVFTVDIFMVCCILFIYTVVSSVWVVLAICVTCSGDQHSVEGNLQHLYHSTPAAAVTDKKSELMLMRRATVSV